MASPFSFRTKPTGVWANFTTECQVCRGEISYRDGRQERHECRERIDLDQPITLADLRAALDRQEHR